MITFLSNQLFLVFVAFSVPCLGLLCNFLSPVVFVVSLYIILFSFLALCMYIYIYIYVSLVLCDLLNVMVVCLPVVFGLLFVLVFPWNACT